jgi:hypothetical protein
MDSVEDTAAKAAQAIEFHGHTKGETINRAGQLCLLGAIAHASIVEDIYETPSQLTVTITSRYAGERFNALAKRIKQILDVNSMYEVTVWNDKRHRTVDEVVHLLKRIANGEGE